MKIFSFNFFRENTIVLEGTGRDCVIIDPGCYDDKECGALFSYLDGNRLTPRAILLTHAHPDHIFGVPKTVGRYGCEVWMNQADKKLLDNCDEICNRLGLRCPDTDFRFTDAVDGSVIEAAGFKFSVISTPGHSEGCVCYYEKDEGILLSGDTLFAGTIGRTDLKYGDYDSIIRSIMEKLILLPPETEVYPGHGPSTTIGRERTSNPMLEPFNEPEETDTEPTPVTIQNV